MKDTSFGDEHRHISAACKNQLQRTPSSRNHLLQLLELALFKTESVNTTFWLVSFLSKNTQLVAPFHQFENN
jgi:hypothetical protein